VPVANFFLDFQSVLGITALYHVASNITKIAFFRKGIDKKAIIQLGIPAVILVIVGGYLSQFLDPVVLTYLLGIFLAVLSLVFLIFKKLVVKPTAKNAFIGGALSGLSAGILGTGGAIRGITLSVFKMKKDTFIASSAVIDLGVDFFEKSFTHNKQSLKQLNEIETRLLEAGFDAISIFSTDDASPTVLEKLREFGIKYITLRSAGHDNINIKTARSLGIAVANTPSYSPNAIAEHAITLLLSFNRKITMAQNQTLRYDFLLDNLIGFDLKDKVVGVMGTGKTGSVLIGILHGFGCKILANDTSCNEQLIKDYGVEYISKDALAKEAQIIFICLPLTTATQYLFDKVYLTKLKKNQLLLM
jgi:phosphoglycerate dehydrogenase-like enzyme